MKVLISGSAGFCGSHLADYLIGNGHTVIGLDNFLTGDIANVHPDVEFHEVDIRDAVKLATLIHRVKPDCFYHLAANPRTFLSVEDPILNNSINVDGTLNCLVVARDAGVKRFVFASSCIMYSDNTPYYVSKLAGEEYCKVFHKLYGLSTISLRYSNVYGSLRQSEKGSHINALASLHKSKRETGRVWITSDGTQTRDWTHITDICRANLLAAQSEATGTWDICTGVNTSMNTIAKFFNCEIDYVPARLGDAQDLSLTQNPGPAERDFGFKAEIPLSEESLRPYL